MNYRTWLAAGALVLSSSALGMGAEKEQPSSATKTGHLDRQSLEKEFAQTLTGATLVGRFTVDGRTDANKPGADRYEIETAEKVEGHRWIITSRIKYGKHDVKVPIPLEVFWAGDTPVITLTHVAVPGLGTFTSRVMVYGDRYAGTWQHDKVGGHLWGHIEHVAASAAPAKDAAKNAAEETAKPK
jgi:hypothetical protein